MLQLLNFVLWTVFYQYTSEMDSSITLGLIIIICVCVCVDWWVCVVVGGSVGLGEGVGVSGGWLSVGHTLVGVYYMCRYAYNICTCATV